MAERLGLAVIPGIGWRANEIQAVAREAEEAGFDAIFAAEVNNDVMATAQLMGAATGRIQVGTWIANIYVRHSYACAQGAALIADATDGRFVLGLGVSHPPVNKALGIDMGDAPSALRRYVTAVRSWLKGEGPATHLPQKPSVRPVPLYVAAITSRTVELAGELAEKGVGGPSFSDRILDAVCLTGSLTRCREQLAAFRSAGVDMPILVAPIGVDGARAVIKAFRR